MSLLPDRHLLTTEGLTRDAVGRLFAIAREYLALSRSPTRKNGDLRGKTIINLFYEASTRTRASFEIAGKRLGGDVINVSPLTSSASKGETLLDTAKNLEAMCADVLVVRHPASGAPAYISNRTRASVVNAGDGIHEHPTQALLDAFTILEKKGRIEGLTVTICGDIAHSRVARSNAHLLTTLGATVRFAGPRTLLPVEVASLGVEVFDRAEPALEGADVVMMLRIQRERLAGALLPTLREYSRTFGLNPKRLAIAKPDVLVLHPGPMNSGVEIDPSVANGRHSAILDQVEAGVAVRAAVLAVLAGGRD